MPAVAEIYHFQHERVIDFREMMKNFLDEQLNFYKEVCSIGGGGGGGGGGGLWWCVGLRQEIHG